MALKKIKFLATPIIVNTLLVQIAIAALPVQYASPVGEENWRMQGNRLRCGLSVTIPEYGRAYFEQYATRAPHFILHKWEPVTRNLPVTVIAKDPVWKTTGERYPIANATLTPERFGLRLRRDATLKTLTYLSQGYDTHINYQSDQGFLVTVVLSPIKFRKKYDEFLRCVGGLISYTYASVKTSVILFSTNSDDISDADKQQLDKVVEYVNADDSVSKIHIAGYADDRGRKSYNNAISENRAKAVGEYLERQGIEKSLLDITWFGAKNPISSNTTAAGMAMNRRVVVQVER